MKSKTDDLEVQVRQAPWGGGREVSFNSAIALRVAGHRVGIYLTTEGARVLVDGNEGSFGPSETALPGGGSLSLRPTSYPYTQDFVVTWPDGSEATIAVTGDTYLSLSISLADTRRVEVAGLLGNYDGNPENDIQTRDGKIVGTSFDEMYGQFANSWRITQAASLFDYAAGQSTETFTDRTFPDKPITVDDLPPADRAAAKAKCRAAGVVVQPFLDNCVLDTGLTKNNSFVTGALFAQAYSPEGAFPIAVGDTVSPGRPAGAGDIGTPGQHQYYTFTGTAGQIVYLKSNSGSSQLEWQLLDPAGNQLPYAYAQTDQDLGRITLPATGTYTITVSAWNDSSPATGTYSFTPVSGL